jgi:hypothetical protein
MISETRAGDIYLATVCIVCLFIMTCREEHYAD